MKGKERGTGERDEEINRRTRERGALAQSIWSRRARFLRESLGGRALAPAIAAAKNTSLLSQPLSPPALLLLLLQQHRGLRESHGGECEGQEGREVRGKGGDGRERVQIADSRSKKEGQQPQSQQFACMREQQQQQQQSQIFCFLLSSLATNRLSTLSAGASASGPSLSHSNAQLLPARHSLCQRVTLLCFRAPSASLSLRSCLLLLYCLFCRRRPCSRLSLCVPLACLGKQHGKHVWRERATDHDDPAALMMLMRRDRGRERGREEAGAEQSRGQCQCVLLLHKRQLLRRRTGSATGDGCACRHERRKIRTLTVSLPHNLIVVSILLIAFGA